MTADPKDGEPGFADLIGQTHPLKEAAQRAPTRPPTPPRATRRHAGDNTDTTNDPATSGFRKPELDEPRLAARSGVSDRQLHDLARGEPEPGERIDLHGLRRAGVPRLLAARFESARERGIRSVLVVHGYGKQSATGEAVLKEKMPDWLMKGPASKHVLAFAPAPNRLGGLGATVVLLARSAGP